MGFYKYRVSKTKAKAYASEMEKIENFCLENGIEKSYSSDSYYFTIQGQKYRVSNHSIESSNRGAYDSLGNKIRPEYHSSERDNDVIYIHASKTRIIEIYTDLKNGYILDGRGYRRK